MEYSNRVPYSESNAYAQTFQAVPKTAYRYTEEILEGFDEATKHLFRHILNSGRIWNREDDPFWVPVPSNLIRREFRNADVQGLIDADLLFMRDWGGGRDYSIVEGKCRNFAVDPDVMRHYEYAIEDGRDGTWVNLFDGKRTRKKLKHSSKDGTGNLYPDLMREAWKRVRPCPFNRKNAKGMVERWRWQKMSAYRELHVALMRCLSPEEEDRFFSLAADRDAQGAYLEQQVDRMVEEDDDSKEFRELMIKTRAWQKAQGRFSNDATCFDTITYPVACRQVEGDIWEYQEAYGGSNTGRATAKGGAFQNCTREFKQAALGELDGILNYDLESSQDYILQEFLQDAGIECPWLEESLWVSPDFVDTWLSRN